MGEIYGRKLLFFLTDDVVKVLQHGNSFSGQIGTFICFLFDYPNRSSFIGEGFVKSSYGRENSLVGLKKINKKFNETRIPKNVVSPVETDK